MDDHWDDPRQLTFDFYLQSDRNQAGGDRNQSSDRQDLNNSMAPIADSLNTPQPLEAAKPKRKADALESSKASYLTDSSPTTENGLDKNPMAGPTMTYQLKGVYCGKSGCKRCPHGPYWYGFWKQDGKTRSKYIGKTL
ncbi:hypothetical protein L3556_13940 [Candidatus Synechococcus calcipolaris G9]|uniref:DUF6788 domain-containing protein n=1 Tax=Candidatus Synechococcus calcipolaris G9 TaxID=1497997 RepID=A0ABT6F2D8_9SYNE|nr:hypothetical protein [Candidatus Synechococcus calcipolaris]MDG2992022.1 hypothetical protein [Candidatus Synechococcus calcipolaris G9]